MCVRACVRVRVCVRARAQREWDEGESVCACVCVCEENHTKAECGYRPGRSTTDIVLALTQIQVKCIGQNVDM